MRASFLLLVPVVLTLAACDEPEAARPQPTDTAGAAGGGKADDVEGCPAEVDDPTILSQRFEHQLTYAKLVCAATEPDGSDVREVSEACCEDGWVFGGVTSAFSDVTGCPPLAGNAYNPFPHCLEAKNRVSSPVEDPVPAVCCTGLCGSGSYEDEAGHCRSASGGFANALCCAPEMTDDERLAEIKAYPDRVGDFGRSMPSSCTWEQDSKNAANRRFFCEDDGASTSDACCIAGCAAGRIDPDVCEAAVNNLAALQPECDVDLAYRMRSPDSGERVGTISGSSAAELLAQDLTAIDTSPNTVEVQIQTALEVLQFGSKRTLDDVFAFVDPGSNIELGRYRIESGDFDLDYLTMVIGGSEVGVAFDHRSTLVAAETLDGDVHSCPNYLE